MCSYILTFTLKHNLGKLFKIVTSRFRSLIQKQKIYDLYRYILTAIGDTNGCSCVNGDTSKEDVVCKNVLALACFLLRLLRIGVLVCVVTVEGFPKRKNYIRKICNR